MMSFLNITLSRKKRFISSTKFDSLEFLSDPHHWQRDDVISWLRYTMHQFNVSESQPNQPIEDWAMIDGPRFMQLTEADFKNKLPEVGTEIESQFTFNYHLSIKT